MASNPPELLGLAECSTQFDERWSDASAAKLAGRAALDWFRPHLPAPYPFRRDKHVEQAPRHLVASKGACAVRGRRQTRNINALRAFLHSYRREHLCGLPSTHAKKDTAPAILTALHGAQMLGRSVLFGHDGKARLVERQSALARRELST